MGDSGIAMDMSTPPRLGSLCGSGAEKPGYPPPPRPDSNIWKGSQVTKALQWMCPLLRGQAPCVAPGAERPGYCN